MKTPKNRPLPPGWPKPTLRDHIAGSWEALAEDWQELVGREPKPRTPDENRARNLRRLRCPRKRSVITRTRAVWWAVEGWVARHITRRDLHRRLEMLRLLLAAPEPGDRDVAEGLERFRREWARGER